MQNSFADSFGQCPFRSNDSSATALAADTKSTITDLLDAKNGCSQQFVSAVTSVEGIPELVKKVQDPDSGLKARLEFINSEIARALSDPNSSPTSIQDLYKEKQEIEKSLRESKISRKSSDKELAKQQLVFLSQNLMSTIDSAMKDPNSQCAQNISKKNASSILSIGLAVLSAGSPLIFAGGAAIAAAVQTLSSTINLFNSLPPNTIIDFQNSQKTKDMACLYHSIVQLSCGQAEKAEQQKNLATAKSRLEQMGSCIPNSQFYNEMKNIRNLSAELSTLSRAVVTTSPDDISGGSSSGSGVERELEQLFSGGARSSGEGNEKQAWETNLKQVDYFKNKIIDHPESFDKLTQTQKVIFNNYLRQLMQTASRESSSVGEATINLYDDQRNLVPMIPLFKSNLPLIQKLFNAKLNDATGGSNSTLLSQNDAVRVHSKVNVTATLPKIQKYRAFLKDLKTRAAGQSTNVDWAQVVNQADESDNYLAELEKWMSISPDGKVPADYRKQIYDQGQALRRKMNLKNGSSVEINDEVNRLLLAPVEKAELILTQRKQETLGKSVFDPGFSTINSPVTDYERFSSLRDTYDQLTNSTLQLADQDLVTRTRDLFEGSGSLLKKNLVEGIKSMKGQISSSSNPEVSKEMVSQLCALAYSLPASKMGENPISECEDVMPEGMKNYLNKNKEVPNCSYSKYFKDKTRDDYFKTGQIRNLPVNDGL